MSALTQKRPVRCAIYTRKSSEEGLHQEFNSLDAQREACQAYIHSQQHEGWLGLTQRYDDGGFTGGSMDRPALQRLLADIAAGLVDGVVVYKVDRLSRSLLDFAKMMAAFDHHQVALGYRKDILYCLRISNCLRHSRCKFTEHRISHENINRTDHDVCLRQRRYHCVFAGRAFICPCLHHILCGQRVGAERYDLNLLFKTFLEPCNDHATDLSTLAVNNTDHHNLPFCFHWTPDPGPWTQYY